MTFDVISDFAVYYGCGREKDLASFSLAIIDPAGHGQSAVKQLKEAGTLTLAYISFLELSPDDKAYELLSENDFLYIDGQLVKNCEYNNLLVDFSSLIWQAILMERISELYLNSGYAGLFIDTLADIEYFDLTDAVRNDLTNAVIAFLGRVRLRFPELIMVQNNGKEFLYRYTAELINGICIENPPYFDKNEIDKLIFLKEGLKLKVLLLSDDSYPPSSCSEIKSVAEKYGFLYYHSASGYLSL